MSERKSSWPLWVGLLLAVLSFGSYVGFFSRYPALRDMPWLNFGLFVIAIALLLMGVRRAFGQPRSTGWRITSVVVTLLGLAVTAGFCDLIFVYSKQLPSGASAPKVGQQAPAFALADTTGKIQTLDELRAAAPKGVLLIFYRGYW